MVRWDWLTARVHGLIHGLIGVAIEKELDDCQALVLSIVSLLESKRVRYTKKSRKARELVRAAEATKDTLEQDWKNVQA